MAELESRRLREMETGINHEALAGIIAGATQEVFGMMLGLEGSAAAASLEEGRPGPSDGVLALLGFTGSYVGMGSLRCSESGACRMASALLGADYGGVSSAVLDAVAEIANMVIGNVKNAIEERLGPLVLSVPAVVFGRGFAARAHGRAAATLVPFLFGGERLEIRVSLRPNQAATPPPRPGYRPAGVLRF